MAVVDDLQIKIQAESVKTNDAIDKLITKLDRLASSLGNIENAKMPDYAKFAKGINKINEIDSNKLDAISKGLRPLADSVGLFNDIKFNNKNLSSFINSITRLSNSNLSGLSGGDFKSISDDIIQLAYSLSRVENVPKQISSLVNGIAKLANAGENANVTAQALPTLANELIKFTGAMAVAGEVAQETVSLTSAIAQLANAGQKAALTAENLEVLGNELTKLFATLSTAPNVSQNIIDMTNALANLANQGSRVGSTSRSIVRGMNNTSNAMKRTTRSSMSLAAAFGRFYAAWFLVIRGAKQLINAIEGTADYIEAFNYYNVALGKIASDWSGDWEKYGYENAEAYAESFTERLDASLNKLSGLQVSIETDGTGLLTESGMKNLGLNIQEVTQYASQLASVTNSVGQTGEVSLATASAFTKLAGDISSLFNVDYSSVSGNLQSALIGQSRAVYKYGIDITNATLQTYAYNLGLEKAVSEMTQAEKMQLRMIAILDQSRVAWGDLANTINSPSNMLRQFTNNVKEAGMVLGQLFIPVLQKILPVINGVVIAIKRLLVSVAQLFGINIDFGQFGQGYSDTSDALGDMSDSLDGVAKSAQKAKSGIRDFDELKTIDAPEENGSTGGAGVGGGIDLTDEILKATEEYEKAWQEAYDRMESKAQEIADNISKYLEPVRKIFEDFSIGDYFQAGKDVSHLVSGIFNFFADAIDKVDWYGIGKKMGDFLAGIDWPSVFKSAGRLIWQGLKAAFELYIGAFSSAPITTTLVSLVGIPKLLKAITSSSFIKGVATLWKNFGIWGEKAELLVGTLFGNKVAASGLATLYPKLSEKVDKVRRAFSSFGESVSNKGLWETIDGGIKNVRDSLSILQKGVIGVVAVFGEFTLLKDAFYDIASGADNLAASIAQIAVGAGAASTALYVAFGPAGLVIGAITGVVAAISGINKAVNEVEAEKFGESVKNAFSNPGGVPIETLAENVANSILSIGNQFTQISEKSNELETAQGNIQSIWREIETVRTKMDAGVLSVEEGTAKLTNLFSQLADVAEEKFGLIDQALIAGFGENGAFRKYAEAVGVDVTDSLVTALGVTEDMRDRANKLFELLSDPNISTEQYVQYQTELQEILGVTDDLGTALDTFQMSLDGIDMSKLFDTDGLNNEELESVLKQTTDAVKQADKDIDTAADNMLKYLNELYENAATEEDKAAIQVAMDVIPGAVEDAKERTREQAVMLTGTIQNELFGGLDKIISDREKQWEEMKPYEKLWLQLTKGIKSKDEYVQEGINNFKTSYADVMDEKIESAMGEIGINGASYSGAAIEAITNSLFDIEHYRSSAVGGTSMVKSTMISDWEDILSGIIEEVGGTSMSTGESLADEMNTGVVKKKGDAQKTAEEYTQNMIDTINSFQTQFEESGQQISSGLKEGISEELKDVDDWTIGNIYTPFINGFRGAFGIASPSKVMKEQGVYIMQGMLNGLTSLVKDIISVFSDLKEKITDIWNDVNKKTSEIWKGIRERLSSINDSIKTKLQNVWNSIKSVIRGILDSIKSVISTAWNTVSNTTSNIWNNIKSRISSVVTTIKTIISGNFGDALSIVRNIFDSIETKISSVMETAKNVVSNAIERIKGFFDFDWSLPSLKLPHFTISGSFSLSPPSVPSFGIDWYAEGGFPQRYSLFAAGENGVPEMLGTVGGKTAVAGGEEITGIRDAIISYSSAEIELLREQNQILRGILQKKFGITEKEIGRAAANYSKDYMSRTGRPAYSF